MTKFWIIEDQQSYDGFNRDILLTEEPEYGYYDEEEEKWISCLGGDGVYYYEYWDGHNFTTVYSDWMTEVEAEKIANLDEWDGNNYMFIWNFTHARLYKTNANEFLLRTWDDYEGNLDHCNIFTSIKDVLDYCEELAEEGSDIWDREELESLMQELIV